MNKTHPLILLLTLAGASSCLFAADGDLSVSGTITSTGLTSAPVFSTPVCRDGTGKLGNCAADHPAKMATVAVNGGNYNSPLAAVSDLGNWCGVPSAANPCLIKVFPGLYDLGNTTLTLQYDYLDMAGSGSNVTTIRGQQSTAIVSVTGNAHIHDIAVENNSGAGYSATMKIDGASPQLAHVVLKSDSGTENISQALKVINGGHPQVNNSHLISLGRAGVVSLSVFDSSLDLYDSKLESLGSSGGNHDAIYLYNSNLTAHRSEFIGQAGISISMDNSGASPYKVTVEHSVVEGSPQAFSSGASSSSIVSVAFADSKLTGVVGPVWTDPMIGDNYYPTCIGNYNGNFQALDYACQ